MELTPLRGTCRGVTAPLLRTPKLSQEGCHGRAAEVFSGVQARSGGDAQCTGREHEQIAAELDIGANVLAEPTSGLGKRFQIPLPTYSDSLGPTPAKVSLKSKLWVE